MTRTKHLYSRLAAGNISRHRSAYLPYLCTCIITIAMFYAICSLSQNSAIADMYGGRTMQSLMQLGTAVVALFAGIFLFYTNSFLIRRRQKEFALYIILGMERRHLARVVAWETLIMAGLGLTLGLAGGIALDWLLFLLLGKLLGSSAPLSFSFSPASMGITAILFGVIFLGIFLVGLRRVGGARPAILLQNAKAGEREPRARWLLALIGLLCLGGGYAISICVTDPLSAVLLFFAAVILVIIGTYLLFTAGSIAVLKLLRRWKRYYYRADHFIAVSGMFSRMKQNAVGLANICILSTMVLVMLTSTLSLCLGMEDVLQAQYPREMMLGQLKYTENGDQDDFWAAIDQAAAASDCTLSNIVAYPALELTLFHEDSALSIEHISYNRANPDDFVNLVCIPLADYNRITGEARTLSVDEVLLLDDGKSGLETLSFYGQRRIVTGHLPAAIAANDNLSSIMTQYVCVVDTLDTLHTIDRARFVDPEIADKANSNLIYHCYFDLDGSSDAFLDAFRRGRDHSFSTITASRESARRDYLSLYGGLLFIGIFLGLLFSMAAVLIIYYKQVSEGHDDRTRFALMRRVGLSEEEIHRTIHTQVRSVFLLPLLAAGMHLAFASPILVRLLRLMQLANLRLYLCCAAGCFLVFALLYAAIYGLTARVYERIVRQ